VDPIKEPLINYILSLAYRRFCNQGASLKACPEKYSWAWLKLVTQSANPPASPIGRGLMRKSNQPADKDKVLETIEYIETQHSLI